MSSNAGAAKTVVVADDTASVRDRFKSALEQAGHHVVTARSATELLTLLRTGATPHLIVLDVRLSNSSGTSLVAAIRRFDEAIPILVFSGTVASAAEVRALAALGVAGYINEHSAAQHIAPAVSPHLFPDNFNRRSSPRISLGIPVQYHVGNTIAAAVTLNLCHGGVAVRTTSPLDAGTRVRVRFRLPGGAADIDAEGRVAWSHGRVGMGLQFEQIDPAAQVEIDNFVDAHFFSNRKA